jgi:hypothetical protein
VAELSKRWNWYTTRKPGGKVVWCVLEVPESTINEGGTQASRTLPRRMPQVGLARPVAVMDDPEILRRVRDGLRELGDSNQGMLGIPLLRCATRPSSAFGWPE